MTGETSMFRGSSQADAAAQYLGVVASNLMVWADPSAEAGATSAGPRPRQERARSTAQRARCIPTTASVLGRGV